MACDGGKDQELRALGHLCAALAKLGMGVQLRDAVPGMTVTLNRDGSGGAAAYVVIHHGALFSWWSVGQHHPVSDIDGAAQRIVKFLSENASGNGDDREPRS